MSQFNFIERYLDILITVSSPNLPVKAFALPELTKIALTIGSLLDLRFLLHWFTEALEVND